MRTGLDKAMRAQHRVPHMKLFLAKFKAIPGDNCSSATRTINTDWNLAFVSTSDPKVSLTAPGNRFYLGCGRIRRVAVEADAP
jgi:hypothetical protein